MTEKKSILCYGDSNTWGAIPGTLQRHPYHVRWTGVASQELGENYQLIEDGINGRRTVFEDPYNPCRNGLDSLRYALYRSKPLDLVVVMLGTNDINHTDAAGSIQGLEYLVHHILHAEAFCPGTSTVFKKSPKVLVISPIKLYEEHKTEKERFAHEQSCLMASLVRDMAERRGVFYLDAAEYGKSSPADGCHMDADSHYRLGMAIAKKIREILD